jgi:hypothetical protein
VRERARSCRNQSAPPSASVLCVLSSAGCHTLTQILFNQLVTLVGSEDDVFKDVDFVQPPPREKRKARTTVEPVKSRGVQALPAWAQSLVPAIRASLYMLYASFYDSGLLDHTILDPDVNPDPAYTFKGNFYDILQELAPAHVVEVKAGGVKDKVYQFVCHFSCLCSCIDSTPCRLEAPCILGPTGFSGTQMLS